MAELNKPIIMTALMGASDFAWADGLRRKHYPPEQNIVPAHVTLFHHLPPQALSEIKQAVAQICREYQPPAASLQKLIHLGSGVAYQIHAPQLLELRMELADMFHGLLVAQDQQRPRLHVTIQNKVSAKQAKQLFDLLNEDFEPRPFAIRGLALQYYLDGPWQSISEWPFRGS